MKQVRFIIAQDSHLADKAPSSRLDDYKSVIFNKIKFAVDKTIEYKANLIFAGDLFHKKRPREISHDLVNKLISLFASLGRDRIFFVLGNHDKSSIESDIDNWPITTLEKANVVTFLRGTPLLLGDIVSLNGIPWEEEHEGQPSAFVLNHHFNSKWKVSVFHQYIIPDDVKFNGSFVRFRDVFEKLTQTDIVISGHFHSGYLGGALRYGEKIFISPGALAREQANESNLSRSIKIGYLELPEEGRPRYCNIEVPHKPANEIFDLVAKVESEAEHLKLEQFAKQFATEIEALKLMDFNSLDDLMLIVKNLRLDSKVESQVVSLLEAAQLEVE